MKRIGIIREGKVPPDSRAPLTPRQCADIQAMEGFEIVVQSSNARSFKDEEYRDQGVPVVEQVDNCDILLGVKEVPVEDLIPSKTYFFFSHTIKAQPYNRDLLRMVLKHGIKLIDYETLTDDSGARLIAFGQFAGMVGAHNALWAFGQRTGLPVLPRMKDCIDYAAVKQAYAQAEFPPVRIVLTGTGRVANGAASVLEDMGYGRIPPEEFLHGDSSRPGFVQLGVTDYATHNDGRSFEETEYFQFPERFGIDFSPFYSKADIMINGIYWDGKAPAFFSAEEMDSPNFGITVISDVTCDIAPHSSIPATLRAATIEDPIFGYDASSRTEVDWNQPGSVIMMTVDNLPNELPRDASESFGKQFLAHIAPELYKETSDVLRRATIASNGKLTEPYQYLRSYVK